jgi:hypothetical protein
MPFLFLGFYPNIRDLPLSESTAAVSYLYIMILPGILVTRHQRILILLCVNIYYLKAEYINNLKTKKQTPWFQSASELYRPSDRRFLTKLVPILADRGRRVVSATIPHGR